MYDLIALVLYATVMTGIAVITTGYCIFLTKKLPQLLYNVGMTIRDESIHEFGLGEMIGVAQQGSSGGRPAEGGLMAILKWADKLGLIDRFLNKAPSGAESGLAGVFGK